MDEDGVEVGGPEDEIRYLHARNGDNLVTPFQCDLCHFRNLMQRDPVGDLPQDIRLLKLIRRANLDALSVHRGEYSEGYPFYVPPGREDCKCIGI